MDYVAQFTTDIRHVAGQHNAAADALSRMHIDVVTTTEYSLAEIAAKQVDDIELKSRQKSSSLHLTALPLPTKCGTIVCDMSTGKPRPWVPTSLRKHVFEYFHSLSHPSIRSTTRLITERFVWPNMRKEICQWAKIASPANAAKFIVILLLPRQNSFNQLPVSDTCTLISSDHSPLHEAIHTFLPVWTVIHAGLMPYR